MYSETKINAQYKTGSNNISLVFLSFKHYFCMSDYKSYPVTLVIGKEVLVGKVVHHNVRDDQPWLKM